MIEIIAYTACAILAALAVFQAALIAGAPLGKFAWGGAHTVLPAKLRVGSLVSIILYGIFAMIILESSGVGTVIDNKSIENTGIWVLVAYFSSGVVLNGISRSRREKLVMTPAALALALLCLFIAMS